MAFRKPDEIAELAVESGVKGAFTAFSTDCIRILGGAFIALGYLLDIRVIGDLPKEWGSLSSLIGASVFPIGLVLVVLAGAELITGNMMSVSMALFSRRISAGALVKNWVIVTLMNLVGALFVAYFFGHVVGLTETGPYLEKRLRSHKANWICRLEKSLFRRSAVTGLSVWPSGFLSVQKTEPEKSRVYGFRLWRLSQLVFSTL